MNEGASGGRSNTDAKFSRDDPVIGGITFGGTAEFGIARDGG